MHTQNHKEPKVLPICAIPAFKRWPPKEKELRAHCSSFLFSRMQAFNRLVDHVTQRLPLLVELAKPHTEHAQSVQISGFFLTSEFRQPFHCWERYGEATETWSTTAGTRSKCAALNLCPSLKRGLDLHLVGHDCHKR